MSSDPVVIRPVRLAELDVVTKLDAEAFGAGAFPHLYFRQMHDLFGGLFQLADVAGVVGGYTLGALGAGSTQGWILSTAVRPHLRGRGLARRLVEHVARGLAERGAAEARLTVAPENAAALALYRRLGFDVVHAEPDYFGPGEPRLVMARPL